MKKYIATFFDDELIFECAEPEEEFVYSSACCSVARYVVNQRPELLKEIFVYFGFDEDDISEFNSLIPMLQVEELGDKFYDDSNWIFVSDYID